MTMSVETCLVVALAFAVFAAVSAIGSSLVLGIGFERLRARFEIVKKQSAYFSDSLFRLDHRVEVLERKDYGSAATDTSSVPEMHHIVTDMKQGETRAPERGAPDYWGGADGGVRFH